MTAGPSSILIADIGGTHARVGYLHHPWSPGARLVRDAISQLESSQFSTFDDFLRAALEHLGVASVAVTDAVFSVAGPVVDGGVHLTNLSWPRVEAARLREAFGLRSCDFVNDLVAAAWGLTGLPATSAAGVTLQQGAKSAGRQALVNIGTGVGVAYWSGEADTFRIDASEAGHMGFAPPSAETSALLDALHAQHGRVSWERVLAGAGLAELHEHFTGTVAGSPAEVVASARAGDAPALASIARFSHLLGVYAGDIALGAPALGGVWLIGGVLDGLDDLLDAEQFVDGFLSKGPMSWLLRDVPVFRVTEPGLGLLGAWRLAVTRGS